MNVANRMIPIIFLTLAALATAAAPTTAPATQPTRRPWLVAGEVQGVGFRAFTHRTATNLKLKGWVRNLTDGRVEIVAAGPPDAVAALHAAVKKGPAYSRVDTVTDAKVDPAEPLPDFEIRDTAREPAGGTP